MADAPTPAEIETLRRKAKHHDLDCTRAAFEPYCGCGADEALAILDRLSPAPEPEVDEATKIWREMVICGRKLGLEDVLEYQNGKWDNRTEISYLRQAIAELIASKDGEIEKAQLWAMEQHKCADEYASELATLRAENERLIEAVQKCRDQFAFYVSSHSQKGTDDGRKKSEVNFNFVKLCDKALKAAERNTAEQKGGAECPTEVEVKAALADRVETSANPYAYGRVHTDGSRSGGMPPGTNAGAVEVTELDHRLWKDALYSRHGEEAIVIAKYRTEAEARGRREALDEIIDKFDNRNGTYPIRTVDELKRMMTGEK